MNEAEIVSAYRRCFPLLRAKCTRLLRNPTEAQDVAQETFMRLCSSPPDCGDARAVTAWLYRTATRIAIERLRRRRFSSDVDPTAHELTPTPSSEGQSESRWALLAIAKLVKANELAAAILCRIDGLTQGEAASVLETNDRQVRRWLESFDTKVTRAGYGPASLGATREGGQTS